MASRRISKKDLLSACSQVGEDDGRDPRYDRAPSARVPNRKALQLCAQVADTLALVLAGECGDDLLRELRVESVRPAPTSAQLLVTLSAEGLGERVSRERALAALERVRARLRSETAAAIHRRRAPQLLFCVVRRV
jgi:ribosome-binding factor A